MPTPSVMDMVPEPWLPLNCPSEISKNGGPVTTVIDSDTSFCSVLLGKCKVIIQSATIDL